MVAIRAVYHNGQLKLLEPVNLDEGQEVQVVILDQRKLAYEVLGDLVASPQNNDDEDFDEVALFKQLDETTRGTTLSDLIIEERHTGP